MGAKSCIQAKFISAYHGWHVLDTVDVKSCFKISAIDELQSAFEERLLLREWSSRQEGHLWCRVELLWDDTESKIMRPKNFETGFVAIEIIG